MEILTAKLLIPVYLVGTFARVAVKDKKLQWKVSEALKGHKLSYAITKGGETVAAQGRKITNSVYKEILKSRIDAVQVESNDLEGAYVAADVIDMETGEVLIEANHELTPTIIGKVRFDGPNNYGLMDANFIHAEASDDEDLRFLHLEIVLNA